MKNIKKWIYIQKEGLIVGALWGLISIYAALGLASQASLTWWQTILVLPAYLGNLLVGDAAIGVLSFAAPVIIGSIIGIIIDSSLIVEPSNTLVISKETNVSAL